MRTTALFVGLLALACPATGLAADFDVLQQRFSQRISPILNSVCLDCHSNEKAEGELDLERFDSVAKIRQNSSTWLKVIEMLETREMPPRDAKQLTPEEAKDLRQWLDDFVVAEADATAGDPGPVVLRRLNNFEYTNTIRALTGQPLDPAKEFPADSAAGEGFTNTGKLTGHVASVTEQIHGCGQASGRACHVATRWHTLFKVQHAARLDGTMCSAVCASFTRATPIHLVVRASIYRGCCGIRTPADACRCQHT